MAQWDEPVADKRFRGTTRQLVGHVFREVERPALQPSPLERFPFFHEAQLSVHRDGHVEVPKAYYSVPPEYLGRLAWVRWDARLVWIFDAGMQQITIHARREPEQFSTQSSHIVSEKINSVERCAAWMLSEAALISPGAERWAKATVEGCGVPGVRVVQGPLALDKKHPGDLIDQASETAASYASCQLGRRSASCSCDGPVTARIFDFLQEHPLTRSVAKYADVVHASFQKNFSLAPPPLMRLDYLTTIPDRRWPRCHPTLGTLLMNFSRSQEFVDCLFSRKYEDFAASNAVVILSMILWTYLSALCVFISMSSPGTAESPSMATIASREIVFSVACTIVSNTLLSEAVSSMKQPRNQM